MSDDAPTFPEPSATPDEAVSGAARARFVEHPDGWPGVGWNTTKSYQQSITFRSRLRRHVEEGILLFAKHAFYLGLWLGTGYFVWQQVSVLRAQAFAGQLSHQYLTTGNKWQAIDALLTKQGQPPVPAK
jgi:hypothetical protein